jgi:hypothetical protein
MDERPSAEIIQFPSARAAPAPEPEQSPELARARLMLALAALETALAGQRQAVARWRSSVDELRGSVAGLGSSMQSYRERLGDRGTRVSTLNGEARRLEQWASEREG